MSQPATISFSILTFSVTALVGATIGSLGIWAALILVGAVTLYALFLKWGLFNEIEGAIVCEILLILVIAAISRVTDEPNKALDRNRQPAQSSMWK